MKKKADGGASAGGQASQTVHLARHEELESTKPCLLSKSLERSYASHALLRVTSRKHPGLRLYARAHPLNFSEAVRGISMLRSIVAGALLRETEVEVQEVPEEEAELQEVVMVLMDRYLSKRDIWHLHLSMMEDKGQVIYGGFEHNLLQHIPNSRIQTLKGAEGPMRAGCVTPRTKVVFRSGSANVIVLIQVSSELLAFSLSGRPYWEVLLDCLTQLVERSFKAPGTSRLGHYVRIVLFARAWRQAPRQAESASPSCADGTPRRRQHHDPASPSSQGARWQFQDLASPCSPGSRVDFDLVTEADAEQEEPQEHKHDDFYEVFWEGVARALPPTQMLTAQIRKVLMRLRESRRSSQDPKCQGWHGVTADDLAEASRGNVLECLNMVLDHLDMHYLDRSLRITGQTIILLTAGNGLVRATSRRIYEVTDRRFLSSGPSSSKALHMICVRQPPLHPVPWIQWPGGPAPGGKEPAEGELRVRPSWIDLSYHSEVSFCPCAPAREWARASFLNLERLKRTGGPLHVPAWGEDVCAFAARRPAPTTPLPNLRVEEASREAGRTKPELWEELRIPEIRPYFRVETADESCAVHRPCKFTEYIMQPTRFSYTDVESEKINTMNDLIGCRLEARTSELVVEAAPPAGGAAARPPGAAGAEPWLADGRNLPKALHHGRVRAADGRIEWTMEPRDEGLHVSYGDYTGEDKRSVELACKYTCLVRRRAWPGPGAPSEEEAEGLPVETGEWLRCRRIFHLPMRPHWNTLDGIVSGVLSMPPALPYPVEPSVSSSEDRCPGWQLRSAIKQHLYVFIPMDEEAQSHQAILSSALQALGGGIAIGVDPFQVMEDLSAKALAPPLPVPSEPRRRAVASFEALVSGLENLLFGESSASKQGGRGRSLGIQVVPEGSKFTVSRKSCTVYTRDMGVPSAHPRSRDWFEVFYDSQFSPPKPFILVLQWLVCSSVHLVNFTLRLTRIARDNGFYMNRMPIAQLFPHPAPHWVWSGCRETNFDRLGFSAPHKVNLPTGLTTAERDRLSARLLQCWLQPPLSFLFLFSSPQLDFQVIDLEPDPPAGEGGPEPASAGWFREMSEGGSDQPSRAQKRDQSRQLFQRLKGWVLCHREGCCLIALREAYIDWYENRLVYAEANDTQASQERLYCLNELRCTFLRETHRVLSSA
uniref:Vacuolar membrane-associated protein Iml1 N-terminal domain-containing protein n=1 Tax=Alexandrium monilatum TaxID=311494 RepID=A0A7S4W338_9DINO